MQRFSLKVSSVLEKIFKVFTVYRHSGHLGQWSATILANFLSLNLRRLPMKFEQNWSGMKATAELPIRAEKAEPVIVFSCICSNEFKILISFTPILPDM